MTGHYLDAALLSETRPLVEVVLVCDHRPAAVVASPAEWGEDDHSVLVSWVVRGTARMDEGLVDLESVEEWATEAEARAALRRIPKGIF